MVYVRSINHHMLYKSKWLIKHNATEYSNNPSQYKLKQKLDPAVVIPSNFFPGKQGSHIIPFHFGRRVFSGHCRSYKKTATDCWPDFFRPKMSTQFVACFFKEKVSGLLRADPHSGSFHAAFNLDHIGFLLKKPPFCLKITFLLMLCFGSFKKCAGPISLDSGFGSCNTFAARLQSNIFNQICAGTK